MVEVYAATVSVLSWVFLGLIGLNGFA